MSNLVEHAKKELELAGLFDKDKDFYGGMTGNAVLELVKVFAEQGHSGMSAEIVRKIFNVVSNFENLTPVKVEDFIDQGGCWQCKRNSALFLNEDKTGYYSVCDKKRKVTLF